MANKKDQEKLMCCRTEIRTTEAMNREIEEKAENLNMGKAQYIIHCIENQPAISCHILGCSRSIFSDKDRITRLTHRRQ